MRVSTDELRQAMEVLLRHLEETGQKEFQIDEDFYWSVPKEALYDQYEPPGELSIGQLTSDWDEVKEILERRKEPIGYALVWLSSVLRAIGEKTRG